MSTRDLRPFGLTPESFEVVAPRGMSDLGRLLLRLLVGQVAASVGLATCIAYAYGPAGPEPYRERVAFSLRLVTLGDEAPSPPAGVQGWTVRSH